MNTEKVPQKHNENDSLIGVAQSQSTLENTKSEPRLRRLKSVLNYEFDDNAFWHDPPSVNVSAMVDYVVKFLSWYRSLPSSFSDQIGSAKIFDEFQDQFVHKMCTEEGEGEPNKRKAVSIRLRHPSTMKDPKERITFNIYRALKSAKRSSIDGGPEGFQISKELLDNWHHVLLEDVPEAKPGIRRAATNETAAAFGHYYIPGEQVDAAMDYFISNFYEMVPDAYQSSVDTPPTADEIVTVAKWAAWALVVLLAIHPYFDGNGRLCRLICNYALSSIFPFDIPVFNVYNTFTSRIDYVKALAISQNCPCLTATTEMDDDENLCLNGTDVFEQVKPGIMATMVLESICFSCKHFYEEVTRRIPGPVPLLEAQFPLPAPEELDESESLSEIAEEEDSSLTCSTMLDCSQNDSVENRNLPLEQIASITSEFDRLIYVH